MNKSKFYNNLSAALLFVISCLMLCAWTRLTLDKSQQFHEVAALPQPKLISSGIVEGLVVDEVYNYTIMYTLEYKHVLIWYCEGFKVVTPVDLDRDKQVMTVRETAKGVESLPAVLKEGIGELDILDEVNYQDDKIGEKLKNDDFWSFACAYKNIITFFQNGELPQDRQIPEDMIHKQIPFILAHEAAHIYDNSHELFSQSEVWMNAAKADGFDVDEYSRIYRRNMNSYKEDFAESVALYIKDSVFFEAEWPNRAKIVKQILNSKKSS